VDEDDRLAGADFLNAQSSGRGVEVDDRSVGSSS
jgi:hypothetical protein